MIPYQVVAIIGIGLASILYYVLSNNQNTPTPTSYTGCNSDRPQTPNDGYNHINRPVQRRRRQPKHSHESNQGKSSQTKSHQNDKSTSSQTKSDQSNENTSSNDIVCTICYYNISMDIIRLRCKHSFHKACIIQWMRSGPETTRYTCPICRNTFRNMNL